MDGVCRSEGEWGDLMKQFLLCATFALPLVLGGCATTSFAPPRVHEDKAIAANGRCPAGKPSDEAAAIEPDVTGALQLVDNFRISYDCAFQQLANGRQVFQVPAALALAGGATAAALGAGPDAAIATGAGASLFNHGNSYYAPQDKARIVAAALDAIMCIKREASGISTQVQNGTAPFASIVGGGTITLEPERQYFQLVSSSLQSVQAIVGERLMSVGSYSPSAIADEIRALGNKLDKAEDPAASNAVQASLRSVGLTSSTGLDAAVVSQIELQQLAPRLDLCTVRAKSG
ncbi:hypothetical protein K426_25970 (plasmid) [Sphingobium sp. TKS]|nr:hypothetical protein K426_25970 [Sphingobium sp. TKS]